MNSAEGWRLGWVAGLVIWKPARVLYSQRDFHHFVSKAFIMLYEPPCPGHYHSEKLIPEDLIWNNRWIKLLNLLTSKLKSLKNGVLINQPANSYPQGEDNKPFSSSQ